MFTYCHLISCCCDCLTGQCTHMHVDYMYTCEYYTHRWVLLDGYQAQSCHLPASVTDCLWSKCIVWLPWMYVVLHLYDALQPVSATVFWPPPQQLGLNLVCSIDGTEASHSISYFWYGSLSVKLGFIHWKSGQLKLVFVLCSFLLCLPSLFEQKIVAV